MLPRSRRELSASLSPSLVGDVLEFHDTDEAIDETAFLTECLALGRQYALQRHIKRQESVSKVLFGTAVKLARNRELWEPGGAERKQARRNFAAEIRATIRRVDAVEALVRASRAGLSPAHGVPGVPGASAVAQGPR
jgi:glycerol-3-phosphate O-acyltransferase